MNLNKFDECLPFSWRLQSAKYGKATYVAYIDARDVSDTLDSIVGKLNWQNDFFSEKNNLFCKIGINVYPEKDNGWVWKSDVGSPSDFEQTKGEASDCFKRAAVKWGIGKFLYDIEIIGLPYLERVIDKKSIAKYLFIDGFKLPYSDSDKNKLLSQIEEMKNEKERRENIKGYLCKESSFNLGFINDYLNQIVSIPKVLKKEISSAKTKEELNEIKLRMSNLWYNEEFKNAIEKWKPKE